MNVYKFSRPYDYIYVVEAKDEKEARKKLDDLFIGDYSQMIRGETKLISKTAKEKKKK